MILRGITWRTKKGVQTPNYWGSVTQASTLRLGEDQNGEEIYVPLKNVLPMVSICELLIGWEFNKGAGFLLFTN
jgi:myo-inositol-1-phosphate synthase